MHRDRLNTFPPTHCLVSVAESERPLYHVLILDPNPPNCAARPRRQEKQKNELFLLTSWSTAYIKTFAPTLYFFTQPEGPFHSFIASYLLATVSESWISHTSLSFPAFTHADVQ